ncbi:Pycsar system effector family protein [Streptomyces sp. NPDC059008]|uniref:Pycsar system effector family protein n=1 Tax=Streptomyces sp. NPDC059008 TaxID=3346693 RepID=UPI0036C48BC5
MATTTPDPRHGGTRDGSDGGAPGAAPPDGQDRIVATMSALQADLARSEGKASLLLALSGAALVALVSAAGSLRLTVPTAVAGALGTAALLAATVLLLLAVRPDLGGSGWTSWSRLSVGQLRERLAAGYPVDHLRFMAALAARKFRLIRAAVDCLLAGVGLLALAAVLMRTT